MSNKLIYGVFSEKKWGITNSRKDAIKKALEVNGTVRYMPYSYAKSSTYWDSVTFSLLSVPLKITR